jgi:hypothetical protein
VESSLHYIRGLTGLECDPEDVEPFRVLLREFKENTTLRVEERVARARANPLAAALIARFASAEDRMFFV